MKEIIDIVHKSIYPFFDVCEDGKEEPLSDKDKLLLSVNKAICNNLKALEQEHYGDCISREAVLKEQYRIDDSSTLSTRDVVNVEDIEQLPSVTHTEKIGQWVFNDTAKEHAHCSECGYGNVDLVNGKPHNYCENCGAKMEMSENREVKMSRENAIRYCDEYLATNNVSNIDKEFLKKAKEALQQQPCADCVSRKAAIDTIQKLNIPEDMCVFEIKSHIEVKIATLPPVKPQEPCSNCCNGNQIEKAKLCQKSYLAGMEHKQEQCADAISRQAAIKAITNTSGIRGDALNALYELPPVNPTKTGHWIEHPEIETSAPEYLMFYECSECGDRQCFCKSDIHKKRFCSNCGCRMVKPQEGGDQE